MGCPGLANVEVYRDRMGQWEENRGKASPEGNVARASKGSVGGGGRGLCTGVGQKEGNEDARAWAVRLGA